MSIEITANDNLLSVLNKINNRLYIDDCMVLFAIDQQNLVINDYVIVDIKKHIYPLMSNHRMVAHFYPRNQHICAAYKYFCYGKFIEY